MRLFLDFGLVASVGFGTLDQVDSVLVVLTTEAELPAGLFGSAFLLALLDDLGTVLVILAVSVFLGAFLFHASLGVLESHSGDLIDAIVFQDTVPEVDSRLVTGFAEAVSPAGDVVVAFLAAAIESIDTVRVQGALGSLSGAVLLDAVFGAMEDSQSCLDGNSFLAVVGLGTLGQINSGLVMFAGQA